MKFFTSAILLLLIVIGVKAQNQLGLEGTGLKIVGPYNNTFDSPYFIKTQLHFYDDTANSETWWETENIELEDRANSILEYINGVFNEYEIYFINADVSSCEPNASPIDICSSPSFKTHHENKFESMIRERYSDKNCVYRIFDGGPLGNNGHAKGWAFKIPNHYLYVCGKNEIGNDAARSETIIHLIGNTLGLLNTFHEAEQATSGICTNCNNCGDRVCETAPLSQTPLGVSNCILPDYPNELLQNYMNNTAPSFCMKSFYEEQIDRIYAFLSIPAEELADALVPNYTFPNTMLPTSPSGNIKVERGTMVIYTPLEMLSGSRITVAPGATLEIRSTITSTCGDMWRGILVEGDGQNQGKVILRSPGAIEHAQIGIDLSNLSGTNNTGFTGGSMEILGGKLSNNQIGLRIHGNSSNSNYFILAPVFSIDDDFRGEGMSTMIDLRATNTDLNIRSGSFSDDRNNVNVSLRATGITSLSSSFKITDLIGPTNFRNLNRGIDASGFTIANTYSVKDALFENCRQGIFSNGVSNFQIQNNDFIIDRPTNSLLIGDVIGIKLINNASGINLSENNFSGVENPSEEINPIGIDICNLGGSDNLIEKNSYNQLVIGNRVSQLNANDDQVRGLRFLCNTFSNMIPSLDHTFTFNFLVQDGASIRSIQAGVNNSDIAPANNSFFAIAQDDYTFKNEGTSVEYKYDGNILSHDPNIGTHSVIDDPIDDNSYDCFEEIIVTCPLCPEEPKDFEALLQTRVAQLQNATNPDVVEQLTGEIYALEWGLNKRINEVVQEFYADTIGIDFDSVAYYMKLSKNFYDDMQIAQFYFFDKNFEDFDQFWEIEIPQRHNLETAPIEQQLYDRYNSFYSGIRPYIQEFSLENLPEIAIDFLEGETSNCDAPAALAGRILEINNETLATGLCEVCFTGFRKTEVKNIAEEQRLPIRAIHLYPNPTDAILTIELPEHFGDATLQVFNLTGQLLHTAQAAHQYQLSTKAMRSGIYFLKVIGKDKITTTQKFQVIH